ncbi:MAG: URC4/urg3 family protein [Elainella sp.]
MQNSVAHSESDLAAVAYLRSTQAIRDRCGQLFELCLADRLDHFRCDLSQLNAAADYVIGVTQANYPDWQIPFHSRWRHFQAGQVDRLAALTQRLADLDPLEQARTRFDLAVTSVLLDAGAGPDWRYGEPSSGRTFQRSEGLAVASYHLFLEGGFSSQAGQLWADASGLEALSLEKLAAGFQVTDSNPLVGLEGRWQLLQQLGKTLAQHPELFGDSARPGGLVDYLLHQVQNNQLSAHAVFEAVLAGFGEIWPGRVTLAGVNLGDVWPHSKLTNSTSGSQLVPFHKLSQWLTYSLLEPLQALGLEITDLDRLTGLAEYRNGGLCLDLGLLHPKDPELLSQPHRPSSEVVVEWRALTLVLLDQIAARIRQQLDQPDLPLAKILEGGTWAAGRQIAAAQRPGGGPPLQIISDGTVF